MRFRFSFAPLLLLVGCEALVGKPTPQPADLRPDDLRDNAIPAGAAEPAWRDLMRHTAIPEPGKALHPSVSRDGSMLAYSTTEFGPTAQVALKSAQGAAPMQITRNGGDNLFPRLSPDGRLLAYASNQGGNYDLYVARVDAPMSPMQVTFEAADEVAPSWSPDGKHLAYCARTPEGVWQLVLVDIGSRVKTFLGAGVYPDWSPDEKDPWICFQSQPRSPGGRTSVWAVRPDGTQLREVVGDRAQAWSAFNPRFSPDGRWIAYATLRRSPESRAWGDPEAADDIWIIRPDGTLDMRLTDDLSPEWWPTWGGDRLFFVSRRKGGQNIFSVKVKPLEDDK